MSESEARAAVQEFFPEGKTALTFMFGEHMIVDEEGIQCDENWTKSDLMAFYEALGEYINFVRERRQEAS